MSKQELLVEYIVRDIVEFYIAEYSADIQSALERLYNSKLFEKLQDETTGLYLCGSAYVYDLFCDELKNGRIIQQEV
jgi:hypothetical protein